MARYQFTNPKFSGGPPPNKKVVTESPYPPCRQCGQLIRRGEKRQGMCMYCYQKARKAGTITVTPQKVAARPKGGNRPQPKGEAWDVDNELRLMRELCRRDFWTFFLYAFGDGRSPKGQSWIDPDVHEPIAKWAQEHVEEWLQKRRTKRGEQKHLAVVVHREVGKSRMFSGALQLWLHLRDPELSSYTGSESTELATKILSVMRGVLDGSDPYAMWSLLYGNWASSARQWTGKAITHAARKQTSRADPSLGTFAVETSIVGAHPDVIFYDDPISYERMTSDSNWLATVNSQVTSLFPVIQSDGLIIWVGTRYDDDDHFGVAFRNPDQGGEGIASLSGLDTDALVTHPEGKWHVYFLAGRDNEGKPTTPKVWPERRLNDYQRRDPLRYAAQVMNDPAISEFNPITKDQIRQCLMPAKEVPWGSLRYGIATDIAFWDGQSRAKKDDTVMIVHGYPRDGSGDVYVVEVYGSPLWRAEDLSNRLVALVQRYRKQGRSILGISDEKTGAGTRDAWRQSLQNAFHDSGERMPPYYEYVRQGTNKIQRMIAAASYWVDGHVRVVEGAPGVENLMEQMAKIGQYMVNPRLKNDYADAHADAFQPEFYQPMRNRVQGRAPFERGARMIEVDGLDREMFDDSDTIAWLREHPRPPLR